MARSGCATVCGFVMPLAMSGSARAEPACSGVVITDVIESAAGERTPVEERCYERAPGMPYYYDAPGPGPRIEAGTFSSHPASMTRFEASVIQALGAQNISDLGDPFPIGQGEAEFQPE